MKFAKGSLPFFDKIQSVVALATPDGFDHGWQVIIARDPNAGHRNRYSVLRIDCQLRNSASYAVRNYACEVDIKTAQRLQKKIVRELVRKGWGTAPQRLTGWDRREPFNYE